MFCIAYEMAKVYIIYSVILANRVSALATYRITARCSERSALLATPRLLPGPSSCTAVQLRGDESVEGMKQ